MTMLNSDKNPVEKSTGFFAPTEATLCDLQVVLLYTMNRKRKNSQKKLSHLHTCEMEKFIVEYLAVYDCIQLSRKELDTIYIRRLQIHRLRERNGEIGRAHV